MKVLTFLALLLSASVTEAGECKTGCNATHRYVETLEEAELLAWLEAYAEDPVDQAEVALETLLFHGEQVKAHLAEHGPAPLDEQHAAFLRAELAKEDATLELRLVEPDGTLVAELGPRKVRLGAKEHLTIDPGKGLQPFVYSGTVQRVGLTHLWGRL